jgi:tRNA G46 methylase TrmB
MSGRTLAAGDLSWLRGITPDVSEVIYLANSVRAKVGRTLYKMARSVSPASVELTFADRSAYKQTWNSLSESYSDAKRHVAGYEDEATFELTALRTVAILEEYVGIKSSDVALEIGCGVGRVGKVLSKRVSRWIGTDISSNMLAHAAQRLNGIENVELTELSTVGLKEIPDQSVAESGEWGRC